MTATINLLSGQQSSIESSDMTVFDQGVGGGGSISSDPTQFVYGAASLKVVTDGSFGFQSITASSPIANFSPSETITLSLYIKALSGAPVLRMFCEANNFGAGNTSIGGTQNITLSTSWQRFSKTVTLPSSFANGGNPFTKIGLRLDTGNVNLATTFWMDCLMITAGGILLPWVPGGGGTLPYMAYIGGAPVNLNAGTLNVTQQIGQRSTGGISVQSALGTTWQYGTQAQIYDDTSTLIYSGFTTKDKVKKGAGARAGVGYLEHDIQLMDNCYRADKRRVFKQYLLQTAGYIVNDLLGSYLAAEGVTTLPGSVATGPTITEVIWNGNKSVGEALTWLATQAGYWWNIDVNNVLWFQPYGGIPAPFVMDGTLADALQDFSVEFGNDMYVNKQYTKGGFAETGVLTETFHGDSLKRAFTLSYPVNTIVATRKHPTLGVKLNGVSQTLGTKGSSGQPFYYAKGDAQIAQDPSQTVLGSGDTLVVTYTGRYPVIAVAQNPALITAQQAREGTGSGIVESTYVNTKVHTIDAAFQIASSLLSHYGQDTTVLTFSTRTKGLTPGQMLTVNLPDYGLNRQMLISAVGVDDQSDNFNIWFRVTCVGSPVESAQWQTYWQSLMNQSSDPSDFTDTQNGALALLLASTVLTTWTGTVTARKTVCPICNTGTLCNTSTIVC